MEFSRCTVRSTRKRMFFLSVLLSCFLSASQPCTGSIGDERSEALNGGRQPVSHNFAAYDGPSTCVGCHREEAVQMFGAVHYQWTGATPNVVNIDGIAGKADRGMNTYCGSVVTSRRIACWTCHAGYGKVPKSTMTDEQLNNIDCLKCHQENYARKAAPPFEELTFTGYDDVARSWNFPIEDAEGNFQFMPDEANMSVTILEAARTAGAPTRASCLGCHAYAAGTDCGKRGDLSSATANPPYESEIHMSPAPGGQDFACQDCHLTRKHRVLGKGLDLRPNDRSERLTCFSGGCHTSTPHDSARLNSHTGRVACQTCHIRNYAKLASTEVRRDWTKPHWSDGLFGGQGGFKPEEIRESMLVPSYRWYNGTSRVFVSDQAPGKNNSVYEFGVPNGWVNTPNAYIHPMKEHDSNSAMHDDTGLMIPHSVFVYFVTGDFAKAVEEAQSQTGRTGAWTMVDIHTYQTLNHGVEPAANALSCGECHVELAAEPDNVRMDLTGRLGYELKGDQATVCTQCHGIEDMPSFASLHREHVDGEATDCSWCHNFTRVNEEQPCVWDGEFSDEWQNAGNWACGRVPSSMDEVSIPSSCVELCCPKITGPLDSAAGKLSIEGGCLVIQSGTFTIG